MSPAQVLFTFPAHFPGRNVPDLSFNADPQTGYVVDYTSSASGVFGQEHLGGTSFVAPQLNGVTALLGQKAGHRLGLLNVEKLYNLQRLGFSFGQSPAIRTISTGDNWFYDGRHGYAPASGVGTARCVQVVRSDALTSNLVTTRLRPLCSRGGRSRSVHAVLGVAALREGHSATITICA